MPHHLDDPDLALHLATSLYRDAWADLITSVGIDTANQHLTATASTIHAWRATDPHITALTERITALEDRMTAAMDETRAALAELNTETDNLAARLDAIAEAADTETAAQIRPISSRLRSLAADPAQPVPPEEPTPVEPA